MLVAKSEIISSLISKRNRIMSDIFDDNTIFIPWDSEERDKCVIKHQKLLLSILKKATLLQEQILQISESNIISFCCSGKDPVEVRLSQEEGKEEKESGEND